MDLITWIDPKEGLEELKDRLIAAAVEVLHREMDLSSDEWHWNVERTAASLSRLSGFDRDQFILACHGRGTKYRKEG